MTADVVHLFPRADARDVQPGSRIEVEHAGGVEVCDSSEALLDRLSVLQLEPLPSETSGISGGGAVICRSGPLEVSLTPDEIIRLLHRTLSPQEIFALARAMRCRRPHLALS